LSFMPAAFLIGVAPQKLNDDVFDEYLEECFINSNGKSAQPVPAEQSYGRRWVYTLYVRGALGEWWEAVLLVMVMLKMLHQFTRAVLGTVYNLPFLYSHVVVGVELGKACVTHSYRVAAHHSRVSGKVAPHF
jgi:hypothetical protein